MVAEVFTDFDFVERVTLATSPHFGRLKIRVFGARSCVEVFLNDGETVMTTLILPSTAKRSLDLDVVQGSLREARLGAWRLSSVWKE